MQGAIHVHLRVHACYDRGVVPAYCADVGDEGLATVVVGAAADRPAAAADPDWGQRLACLHRSRT